MQIIPLKDVPKEVVSKVSTAKVSLMTKPEMTFFTTALMRLNLSYTPSVNTLATDGLNLFVNPNFVEPLSNRQIAFGLLHEVMHVIYDHIIRKGTRDHKTWNRATDYVINNTLDDMGMDVIDGICLDHQYDGMSADQVYAKLMKDKQDNPNTPEPDPTFDDMVPNQTPTGNDSNGNPFQQYSHEQIQSQVRDIVDQSIMSAKMSGSAGSIPGDIMREYNERLKPRIPWRKALSDFLFAAGNNGSSYKKPSRRGLAQNLVLPGKMGRGLGRIDFSIDTSGSVSQEMFNQFLAEIASVFDKFRPKSVGISQFDHELKSRDVVNNLQQFRGIKFTGGGGTNIYPVMEMFKEVKESKALIVLTDGYFSHSKGMDPKKPVVWCIYDNPNWVPPFGKAIHFKIEDLQ